MCLWRRGGVCVFGPQTGRHHDGFVHVVESREVRQDRGPAIFGQRDALEKLEGCVFVIDTDGQKCHVASPRQPRTLADERGA